MGLDDAWQELNSGPGKKGYHNASGDPIVNTTRFPNMGEMVQYAHALNLTAGWYGNNCMSADMNSSVVHFERDVAAFRRFGFDSYKLDSCGGQKDIALWTNLLTLSGGGVVIEDCHNGPYFPSPSYRPDRPPYCPWHFYRTSVDIEVLYGSIFGINLPQTLAFTAQNLSFPGCWGYPDMLEVCWSHPHLFPPYIFSNPYPPSLPQSLSLPTRWASPLAFTRVRWPLPFPSPGHTLGHGVSYPRPSSWDWTCATQPPWTLIGPFYPTRRPLQ